MDHISGFRIQSFLDMAIEAGDIALRRRGKIKIEYKPDGSPVTDVDKDISKMIISELQRLTPDIPVVSEEASREENLTALQNDLQWVIDPVDGTRTFIEWNEGKESCNGWGIRIGLCYKGVPIKGIDYYPAKGEILFTGDDGKAYRQIIGEEPKPLSIHNRRLEGHLKGAVHWDSRRRPSDINGHNYKPRPGVGGERISMVATGGIDIAWMDDFRNEQFAFYIWDTAASVAILNAAGGEYVHRHTGEEILHNTPNFLVPVGVAASPHILQQLGFKPQNPAPEPLMEP